MDLSDHEGLQAKWSERWHRARCHEAPSSPGPRKFYNRDAAPYPNGDLHIGHLRNYVLGDIIARYKRQCGYDVLYATNFDAFGLPNELAAIRRGISPEVLTRENIERMCTTFRRLGISYDWARLKSTADPGYYKWTQWLFLRLHAAGMVYRALKELPWCESCQVTLAFMQIADGECWRCGTEVVLKAVPQWFIRLAAATPQLDETIGELTGWSERSRNLMRGFIGRTEGELWRLPVACTDLAGQALDVFVPAHVSLASASFVAVAAASPALRALLDAADGRAGAIPIARYLALKAELRDMGSLKGVRRDKTSDASVRAGFDTGLRLVTPGCAAGIAVWMVNYLSVEAGPAARACSPADDRDDDLFARRHGIAARPAGPAATGGPLPALLDARHVCHQVRDWAVSRGRAWGTPLPFIHCERCGPVPIPEQRLPLTHADRLDASGAMACPPCPSCGTSARYDPETIDCNFDDSWCFVTGPYTDPAVNPFLDANTRAWLPVDWYHSGFDVYTITHVHRFVMHFLHGEGLTPCRELIEGYRGHDLVLGVHGKISKRYGNEGDLGALLAQYGSDVLRLSIAWAANPGKQIRWTYDLLTPAEKLLRRLARLVSDLEEAARQDPMGAGAKPVMGERQWAALEASLAVDIGRISAFIQDYRPNAALSLIDRRLTNLARTAARVLGPKRCHEFDRGKLRQATLRVIQVLSPMAPFACEEAWECLGGEGLVSIAPWPGAPDDQAESSPATRSFS